MKQNETRPKHAAKHDDHFMTKKQTKKYNIGLLDKLPTLNLEWPDDLQKTWWRIILEIKRRLAA